MTQCSHKDIRCLNHYDLFRKYHCDECGKTLMCRCEEKLPKAYVANPIYKGIEFGTSREYTVNGFEYEICAVCRGKREDTYPRAAIPFQKGKVERFYWREIFKTYCELCLSWMEHKAIDSVYIIDFESLYPNQAREFKLTAKQYWQKTHKTNPKYSLVELSQDEFLSQVSVPIKHLEFEYQQIERDGTKIGKWVNQSRGLISVEDVVTEYYQGQGYTVFPCERTIISVWVGTFLCHPIQSDSDPRARLVMRNSTKGWTPQNRDTGLITFNLPEDFGSKHYFERRKEALMDWIQGMSVSNLVPLFNALLDDGELLRDYLWVNNDISVQIAREALLVIPKDIVIQSVEWAIGDFWNRQPGWPDLFIFNGKEYFFSEIKSPYDKLSQDQMNWFRWAVETARIPCEICKVARSNRISTGEIF